MKKLYFRLFIVVFILSASPARAQVFGYPGATWVFHSPSMWGMCFDLYQKWDYVGDTMINGITSKDIKITNSVSGLFPPTSYTTNSYHRYFNVSGDTVLLFNMYDTTWQEIYNFSLEIGDSIQSPLGNLLNGWAVACADSIPYLSYATVVDTGHTNIGGQYLRFYTVKYYPGLDTTVAFETYYERIITLDYWYPNDWYWCGAVPECGNPELICYKDNGMTDSLCADFTWFETLDIGENIGALKILIYPNPVHDNLSIQNSQPENYQILSYDGKLISTYIGNSIDVSQLSSGLYFITNENRTWFRKFIKN